MCILLSALLVPGVNAAPPQTLPDIGYKYYWSRDLVFVNFVNPYFTPVNNVIINMTVREGTGSNRVIAIGQTRMPPHMIMNPGEHTSARVPIRARIIRDLPINAQFEFKIMGRQIPAAEVPPSVVVMGGGSLEVNRDQNRVPFVMGFITLDPLAPDDAQVTVQMAVLTFYDESHRIVWSEIMAIAGTLTASDAIMLFGKYEAASQLPDVSSVEAHFVALPTGGGRGGR
jgi:hypothetical protein